MLTDADRAALDLESALWKHTAVKEQVIRDRLGVSALRHHQRVARLIDDPAAIAYAPTVCARLRAVRDGRRLRLGA